MTSIRYLHDQRKGFALIAVLASLAILTSVFAIATDRTLAYLADIRSEVRLLDDLSRSTSILRLSVAWKSRAVNADLTTFDVTFGDRMLRVHLNDVGGLVDLNTGAPALVEIVADAAGVDDAGLARFRAWRRDGNRLLRLGDFNRVAATEVGDASGLGRIATLYSGRRGIAVTLAPPALTALLGSAPLPPDLQSPASGVNFVVLVVDGTETRRLGTIHAPAQGSGRLLAVE